MKKEIKKWKIVAELHRLSDYQEEKITETRTYYRTGVSDKQVISQIRYTEKLYDYDNNTGSVAYKWVIKAEEENDNRIPRQLKLDLGL